MKNRKILLLLIITLLVLSIFTSCVSTKEDDNNKIIENDQTSNEDLKYPMEVTDAFGNTTTINKKPSRIVSLAPSHTEILFKLGLEDKIIGVTNWCDYPVEAQNKEKVGDAFSVNVEKIIELSPDLVLQYGPGNEEVNKQLRDAGISVLCYEPESIDEVIDLINEIGKITGAGALAKTTTVDMMSKRDYIINTVKDAEKVKVFYEVSDEPLITAGPGSFIDELITLAGGENIASDAEGPYPQFDIEKLIERDPDVYLANKYSDDKTVESIKNNNGYEALSAVKNDRIYILDPNIVSRPGPRIVDGLELIAKTLHPDLFK